MLPSEELLQELGADVRGIFPLTSHNWDVYSKLQDRGNHYVYLDDWGFTHHFPKDGYWFSLVKSPMEEVDFSNETLMTATYIDFNRICHKRR